MRNVDFIVVHCTATPQNASIQSIKNYWRNVMKWSNVGYHVIIEANGKATQLAGYAAVANGVKGYNRNSIHVAYIGGIDAKGKPLDNRTDAQKKTLREVLTQLKRTFPNAVIQGHRDFAGVVKACPSFDAKTEYASLY